MNNRKKKSVWSKYGAKGKYSFPDDSWDSQTKHEKKYCLEFVQAVAREFATGNCFGSSMGGQGANRESRHSIQTLRAYAKGLQDIQQYKPKTDDFINKLKIDYNNISWEPPPIIVKYKEVIQGMMLVRDYGINISSIDPLAQNIRDYDIEYLKMKVDPMIQKLVEETGAKLPKKGPELDGVEFTDATSIDLYNKIGGYKLQEEIAAWVLLTASLEEHSFNEETRERIISDLVDIGFFATRVTEDKSTNRPHIEWVDPEFIIARYSRHNDHRNIDYAGERKFYTVAELIKRNPELNVTDLQKISKLGDSQTGQFLDDSISYANTGTIGSTFSRKIEVLEIEWLSLDDNYYTEMEIRGANTFNRCNCNYEIKEKDKRKGKTKNKFPKIERYFCKWIVGTDIVLDCGRDEKAPRSGEKGKRTANLSYTIHKTGRISIVERMIPFADDFAVATFKLRALISSIPPGPRLMIDESSLSAVNIGGNKVSAPTLTKLYALTGKLFYRRVTSFQNPNAVAHRPIDVLPTGVAEDFNLLISYLQHAVSQIQEITGINQMADASTPNPRMLKGVAQMAMQGTSNALHNLIHTYAAGLKGMLKITYRQWQMLVDSMNEDMEVPYRPFGSNVYQVLKISKDTNLYDMGIIINPVMSLEKKAALQTELVSLREIRKQTGRGGLSISMYFRIQEVVERGNLDLAAYMMANEERLQRIKDQEDAAIAAQQEAAMKQQIFQAKGDEEVRKIEAQKEMWNSREVIKGEQERLTLEKKAEIEGFSKGLEAGMQEIESTFPRKELN